MGRILSAYLVLCLGAMLPLRASADSGPVLVLGVSLDGKHDAGLRDGLAHRLARAGLPTSQPGTLTPTELACVGQECLDTLGERTGARWILSFAIQKTESREFFLEGFLYSLTSHMPVGRKSADCKDCDRARLAARLDGLADSLLEQRDAPPTAPVRASAVPVAAPTMAATPTVNLPPPVAVALARPTAPRPSARRPAWRYGVGIPLMVLGAAGVVVGGVLASMNGQVAQATDSAQCDGAPYCRANTGAGMGVGFGLGLAALAGGVALVAWPPTDKEVPR